MGISLIVTKSYDREFHETGQEIAREEWLRIVDEDPVLRLRTKPFSATNPKTGEVISISAGDAQAEFVGDDGVIPFLSYRSGELSGKYVPDLEDPDNAVRRKIVEVAGLLDALITHDAGDEFLDW
ncbi:MAG: hypothetical protein JSU63_02960 [Phycisphaerales bacterium]|nr:MAG: hypothetical protein JSU63_02960 [Phycisphaerales bacterium]